MFGQLYPRLTLLLTRRFHIPLQDAEDAIQDVFVRLLALSYRADTDRRLRRGGDAYVSNYILRAVLNRVIDKKRQAARQASALSGFVRALETGLQSEQELVTADDVERVQKAVSKLKEPYRSVFRLLLSDGISLADVARKLGIKQSSIYVHYRRGLARLRALMKESQP